MSHLAPFDVGFDPQGGEVAARLNAFNVEGIRFECSMATMKAVDYERKVADGGIPTRNVAHDWFNGLVWLKYPVFKRLMNGVHVEQALLGGEVGGNGRSRVRDAVTLLDESGAVLLLQDEHMLCALLTHDWHTLFVRCERSWLTGAARLCVVGHGLLDAMQTAHKGLCAKVLPVLVDSVDGAVQTLDALLPAMLPLMDAPANFSPLPVMGVPGWFEESRVHGFYEDPLVFRAKPTRQVDSVSKRLAFEWQGTTLSPWKCAG